LIAQYGVIAWRKAETGAPEILLITSRETRRWVVPRGNPMPGLRPYEAAAEEAYEEAGVRGGVQPEPLGCYHYDKRLKSGAAVPAEVHLFPMVVTEEAGDWPERHQRDRQWFSPEAAAEAVEEAELKALLLNAANWR
jgi:8-oxo-dGTP pyrophosphatase MutT (NUDIX family)